MTSPQPLQPGVFYHLFNRGTNGENLFYQVDNYRYFLKLYSKHVEPVASTCADCLMPNHFHFLIYIYSAEEQFETAARHIPRKTFRSTNASQAFSNLFNAYSKSINKARSRTGSLFEHPFHRIPIRSNSHFCYLITYIHQNPQKHAFVQDYREWPYSSYSALISSGGTLLNREQVISWFGGAAGLQQPYVTHQIADEHRYLLEEIDESRTLNPGRS